MKLRRVIVHWQDAILYTGEYSWERAAKLELSQRKTMGWLLNQDKEVTRLALTEDADGCSDVFVFPTGWIKKMERI